MTQDFSQEGPEVHEVIIHTETPDELESHQLLIIFKSMGPASFAYPPPKTWDSQLIFGQLLFESLDSCIVSAPLTGP